MKSGTLSERTARGAWLCMGIAVGALGMVLLKSERGHDSAPTEHAMIMPMSASTDAQNGGGDDAPHGRPPKRMDDDGPMHRRGGGNLNIVPGPGVAGPATQPGDRPGMVPRRVGDIVERCLEVAEDIDPAVARRLRALREREPEEFERTVRQVGRQLMILADLKTRDADLYRVRIGELQTESQINRTSSDLCAARAAENATEVAQLEQLLKNQLAVQLTYSIKARTEYLCRLREQCAKVEGDISRDTAAFASIVEERYQAILNRPPCDPLDVLKNPNHPNEDGPPGAPPPQDQ
ncbi:MAG TPA: hypothetical protein VG711_06350 [Phycisphaerales bacterium]|nr:hypothetical protein [Phycisphaerales bacterium]